MTCTIFLAETRLSKQNGSSRIWQTPRPLYLHCAGFFLSISIFKISKKRLKCPYQHKTLFGRRFNVFFWTLWRSDGRQNNIVCLLSCSSRFTWRHCSTQKSNEENKKKIIPIIKNLTILLKHTERKIILETHTTRSDWEADESSSTHNPLERTISRRPPDTVNSV